jgi:ELWxxDGT repeat protein
MVKDINTASIGASSNPSGLIALAGHVYFSADNGVNGRELWKSDGTAAGTVLVKNIRPGKASSMSTLTASVLGNSLCFQANNGTSGSELWKSNGTAAGTVIVKNIRPGANQSSTPNQRP